LTHTSKVFNVNNLVEDLLCEQGVFFVYPDTH